MNRLQLRAPKALRRRPYRARRAPQHHAAIVALTEARPVPRSMVVLVGALGALVVLELAVAVWMLS